MSKYELRTQVSAQRGRKGATMIRLFAGSARRRLSGGRRVADGPASSMGAVPTSKLENTRIYTEVSIRHLQEVHARTHPGYSKSGRKGSFKA